MTKRPFTSLRHKIHVKHGFPFKGEHFRGTGPYVVLTPGNFSEEGGFKRNAAKDKCYSELFPEEYLLKKGDILVAMTEQTDGLLGSMAKIPESNRFLHNQRLGLVTALTSAVDVEFLYHLFKTKWVRKQIRRSASGSKVKHTSPERLYDVQVQLPSPREQAAIATILSALDAKIEINNRLNEELEGMAKLLYDYWFVQFDFPITAAQAAAMGKPRLGGKPYRASGGRMVYNDAHKREIPYGWKSGNILALSDLGGGATPSKHVPEFWRGSIPFFTPTDAESEPFCLDTECHITQLGLGNSATRLYRKGTLFITARGSVGKAMIISRAMAMNQSCYALCPHDGVGSAFLYFHTLSLMDYLHAKSSGSIFKSIVTNDIAFTPAIVPASEQLAAFNDFAEPVFQSILTHQEQSQQLTALRDWLLPMLMNGQVSVGGCTLPRLSIGAPKPLSGLRSKALRCQLKKSAPHEVGR
ncbi:MAG: restriction endonuclease subunit S [Chthoniobacteraceae bacterium]